MTHGSFEHTAQLSTEDLIFHIYEQHHRQEREWAEELSVLANRVLLAHYAHGKETVLMLHRNISLLQMELEALFAKEEKELFRLLRKGANGPDEQNIIRKHILARKEDQERIQRMFAETSEKTDGFTPPPFACATMAAMYEKLGRLADDFSQHTALENDVLYARFQ